MTLLLLLALAAEPAVACPGPYFLPRRGPGSDVVTIRLRGCVDAAGKPTEGGTATCDGYGITAACCDEWVHSGREPKPACAVPRS